MRGIVDNVCVLSIEDGGIVVIECRVDWYFLFELRLTGKLKQAAVEE